MTRTTCPSPSHKQAVNTVAVQLRSPRCCHWWPRAQGARAKTALSRAPISRHGGAGLGRTMALGRGGRRGEELPSWRRACHGSKRIPRRVGRPFVRAHGAVREKRRLSGRALLPWLSTPRTWRSGAADGRRGRAGWREMRRAGW